MILIFVYLKFYDVDLEIKKKSLLFLKFFVLLLLKFVLF